MTPRVAISPSALRHHVELCTLPYVVPESAQATPPTSLQQSQNPSTSGRRVLLGGAVLAWWAHLYKGIHPQHLPSITQACHG
jgi:hypothetical protein